MFDQLIVCRSHYNIIIYTTMTYDNLMFMIINLIFKQFSLKH